MGGSYERFEVIIKNGERLKLSILAAIRKARSFAVITNCSCRENLSESALLGQSTKSDQLWHGSRNQLTVSSVSPKRSARVEATCNPGRGMVEPAELAVKIRGVDTTAALAALETSADGDII
jgi:hypothetical protein